MLFEGENVLPDDHVIQPGCFYVVIIEKVVVANMTGTIKDLKKQSGVAEIRNCNTTAREENFKNTYGKASPNG